MREKSMAASRIGEAVGCVVSRRSAMRAAGLWGADSGDARLRLCLKLRSRRSLENSVLK
jgi:hypothetical protein